MKTVFVLRHGKSDWGADFDSDHERPLAPRGVAAAELMGRFLVLLDSVPQKVWSSTAVRARHTAELAMAAGPWQCPASFSDSIYGAAAADILDLLTDEDDEIASLLLVGHQPTWSELIRTLTGGMTVRFPTAALARIDCEIRQWRQIDEAVGRLRWLVTPKLLQRAGLGV